MESVTAEGSKSEGVLANFGAALTRGVLVASFGHFALEFCHSFLPVMYPLLISEMGLTYTQVGTVALTVAVTGTLTQPLFGYLSDRWRAAPLSALAVAWTALWMGVMGFMPNYVALLILVGMGSLGSAAFHPPGAVLAAAHSGNRRGAGVSIFSVGGNLGSALGPVWVAAGFGVLGIASPVTLIPLGLAAAGLMFWQLSHHSLSAKAKSAARTASAGRGFVAGLVLIIVSMMARSWFQVSLTTYLPVWVESGGGSVAAGARLLSVLLFSIGAGSLIGGALADRVGAWQVIAVSMTALSPFYWLFLNGPAVLQPLFLVAMGVMIGSTFPTALIIAQDCWPRAVGVASGLIMGLSWMPGGIGASFTGYIADNATLGAGLQTLLVAPLISALCIWLFALLQRRWQMADGG